MRFAYPFLPAFFDVPDDWLVDLGAFPVTYGIEWRGVGVLVKTCQVEPPFRGRSTVLDGNGFDRERLRRVLRGLIDGAALPPLAGRRLPERWPERTFKVQVINGFHRYHAAVMVGCPSIAVEFYHELIDRRDEPF